MHPTPRTERPRGRWPAAPGLLVAILAGIAPTPAIGAADAVAGSHGHRCKCGLDCGHACCCSGVEKAKARTKPISEGRAPCLDASPCGGEGLPNVPPSSLRIPKAAALALPSRPRPPLASAGLIDADPARPRKLAPIPPDEPPERRSPGA